MGGTNDIVTVNAEAVREALEHLKIIRSGVSSIRQWVTFFGIIAIIGFLIVLLQLVCSAAK